MDRVLFNETLNKLKQLAGNQGAFILFLSSPNEEGEENKFRTHGNRTRVEGVFCIGSRIMAKTAADYDQNILRQHDPD